MLVGVDDGLGPDVNTHATSAYGDGTKPRAHKLIFPHYQLKSSRKTGSIHSFFQGNSRLARTV